MMECTELETVDVWSQDARVDVNRILARGPKDRESGAACFAQDGLLFHVCGADE